MAYSDKAKLVVLVAVLLGVIAIVDSGQNYADNNRLTAMAVLEQENVTMNITNGWNMVGVDSLYNMIRHSTTCDVNNMYRVTYGWNPEKNDYDTCQLSDDFKTVGTDNCAKITNSVWMYNYGGLCEVNSELRVPAGGYLSQKFNLKSGWNMLSVQKNWVGKKPQETPQIDCSFELGWEYKSDKEGWDFITPITPFRQDQVGKGIWAYCAS